MKNIEPDSLRWLERPAVRESFSELLAFVMGGARAANLSEDNLWKLELAVEELVTNVIRHGYAPGESASVRVGYGVSFSGDFSVQIRSGGVAFNPLLAEAPDLTLDVAQRGVGGLGIHLVKTVTDQIDYQHEAGINVVSFRIRKSS